MSDILIYDDIGPDYFGEGITNKSIKEQLDDMGPVDEITVRIDSLGGDVFHGASIYNLLKEHPARIRVKIDGIAASAASVIAMAGDAVEMADNSIMMIHDPYTFAIGDAEEMLKTAERLEKVKSAIITTYASRTGIDEQQLAKMMSDETWMTAREAVDHGFADEKTDEPVKIENKARPWIRNMPTIETRPAATAEDDADSGQEENTTAPPATPLKIAAKLRMLDMY